MRQALSGEAPFSREEIPGSARGASGLDPSEPSAVRLYPLADRRQVLWAPERHPHAWAHSARHREAFEEKRGLT